MASNTDKAPEAKFTTTSTVKTRLGFHLEEAARQRERSRARGGGGGDGGTREAAMGSVSERISRIFFFLAKPKTREEEDPLAGRAIFQGSVSDVFFFFGFLGSSATGEWTGL